MNNSSLFSRLLCQCDNFRITFDFTGRAIILYKRFPSVIAPRGCVAARLVDIRALWRHGVPGARLVTSLARDESIRSRLRWKQSKPTPYLAAPSEWGEMRKKIKNTTSLSPESLVLRWQCTRRRIKKLSISHSHPHVSLHFLACQRYSRFVTALGRHRFHINLLVSDVTRCFCCLIVRRLLREQWYWCTSPECAWIGLEYLWNFIIY